MPRRTWWQCEDCGALMAFVQIWQDSKTGKLFCGDCWPQGRIHQLTGISMPWRAPVLCEECESGIPVAWKDQDWSGKGPPLKLCEKCSRGVEPEEQIEAIESLMRLLDDTED